MESTVRPPDAVLWHEGMLLAPQHFQQAALRSEELLHYRLRAAAPFAWGVRHLRVEPRLLAEGTFRVAELEAILPDGVVATVRGDRDGPLEVDLKPYEEAARRGSLAVHLAVPAAQGAGEPAAGQLARFDRVEGAPVPDDNTGDGAVPVPRLRPRLSLLVADVAPDKYTSLPLARLRFRDGAFVLATYVPPVPAAAPGNPLHRDAAVLARRIREKALFFADRARAAAAGPRDATTEDLSRALAALTAGLPRLDALVSLGAAHPLDLYLAVCDAAGALAGLEGRVPPIFPRYDHLDLHATFHTPLVFCAAVLDGMQETYTATPFVLSDGVYAATPPAPTPDGVLLVGVRPGTLAPGDAAAWLERCRIGSASRMASLAGRRIRGAARRRLAPTGELALAAGAGVLLFAVEADAQFVAQGEPLQVVHPDEPGRGDAPAELVLYTRIDGAS
jgi:type VI secretion system protein ImpJ